MTACVVRIRVQPTIWVTTCRLSSLVSDAREHGPVAFLVLLPLELRLFQQAADLRPVTSFALPRELFDTVTAGILNRHVKSSERNKAVRQLLHPAA